MRNGSKTHAIYVRYAFGAGEVMEWLKAGRRSMFRFMVCLMAAVLGLQGVGYSHGTGPVLHLRGQDVSESYLRDAYVAIRDADPEGWAWVCSNVVGKSAEDALAFMGSLRTDEGRRNPQIMTGATPRPGQVGTHTNKLLMAVALQEECE